MLTSSALAVASLRWLLLYRDNEDRRRSILCQKKEILSEVLNFYMRYCPTTELYSPCYYPKQHIAAMTAECVRQNLLQEELNHRTPMLSMTITYAVYEKYPRR